jgi:hypothetical protein
LKPSVLERYEGGNVAASGTEAHLAPTRKAAAIVVKDRIIALATKRSHARTPVEKLLV